MDIYQNQNKGTCEYTVTFLPYRYVQIHVRLRITRMTVTYILICFVLCRLLSHLQDLRRKGTIRAGSDNTPENIVILTGVT